MDILKNLNHRLTMVDEEEVYSGGEEYIKEVICKSPIQLPEDYIEYLRCTSGGNVGASFLVDNSRKEIWIWNAEIALEKLKEFSYPIPDDSFFRRAWLIGDNLGDYVYFYAEGKDGFGIYKDDAGNLYVCDGEKIADTLTDFLVRGIGIDTAV